MTEVSSVPLAGGAGQIEAAPAEVAQALLVAFDWGTSSLRAYLFGPAGQGGSARAACPGGS